jgi:hypothetical protein
MKVTKREFVKGAAATVVVVATAHAVQITHAQTFDLVVFNDWFPQARAFAASFSEQGTRALAVAGDAGRLWYGTLRGLITDGQRRIAGLTTHTDLLILETLARDKGLRVSQRENAGRLVSWVLS